MPCRAENKDKIRAPVTYGVVKWNSAHLRLVNASVPISQTSFCNDILLCAHVTELAFETVHRENQMLCRMQSKTF